MARKGGTFTLVLDGKDAQRKISQLDSKLSGVYARKTFEIAESVRKMARDLVPKETRKTERAIISVIRVRSPTFGLVLVGFERNPHPYKRWLGGDFNLPAWMTYSRKAITGWRAYGWGPMVTFNSGNPRFLIIAAGMAKTRYGKEIETNVGAVIKG